MSNARISRRGFLTTALRAAAGAGLAAVGAMLAFRGGDRRGALGRQTCIGEGLCTRCGEFNDCGLPAAESKRQATGITGEVIRR